MSLVQPPVTARRPSPSTELGTNNPFRRRLSNTPSSPISATERFSFSSSGGRPQSRNPFLDVFDDDFFSPEPTAPKANSFDSSSTLRPQLSGAAAELFENLTIQDHSGGSSNKMSGRQYNRDNMMPPPRPQRGAPRQQPFGGHQHSRSSDDKGPQLIPTDTPLVRPPPPHGYLGPRRPPGRPNDERPRGMDREPRRRPRRNSDSSVIDAHEAEQKDMERRERRHREQRPRGENSSGSGSGRRDKEDRSRRDRDRKKNVPPLDVIDKLDATGVFGAGLFHHDGPFDACNPHRNKNSRMLAPVHAFPADSANNALSGFGPVNAKADHTQFFGNRDPEAFNDFTASGRRPSVPGEIGVSRTAAAFDPKKAEDLIHGEETPGLGTSTFLDGTPASRAAVQKSVSESTEERPRSPSGMNNGGLQRKKSLAQKFRSISQNRTMDGPIQSHRRPPPPPNRSPTEAVHSPVGPSPQSNNPFFSDYDNAYDRKGEIITVAEKRAPGSPRKPSLGRVQAGDGKPNENGGLMKRVRSLSKSKRRDL